MTPWDVVAGLAQGFVALRDAVPDAEAARSVLNRMRDYAADGQENADQIGDPAVRVAYLHAVTMLRLTLDDYLRTFEAAAVADDQRFVDQVGARVDELCGLPHGPLGYRAGGVQ